MRMRRQNIMYLPLFLVKQFKSLPTPSPFAFNLFQHQSLFQWVSSFHKVTIRLSLQLQHQSLKYFQGKTHISYDSCICSQVFTTRGTWEARYLLGSERCPGGGRGNPLQYSCLGNAMDRGECWAIVHGVIRVGHNLVTKPAPYIDNILTPLFLDLSASGLTDWFPTGEDRTQLSFTPPLGQYVHSPFSTHNFPLH